MHKFSHELVAVKLGEVVEGPIFPKDHSNDGLTFSRCGDED